MLEGETMTKRILIVEDEKTISRFIELELRHEQFDVALAFDGREGLNKAINESFDCILLDVMLPKLNGIEVCRRIRAQSVCANYIINSAR
ncbi:Two-component system response regulator ArlR OS=Ureibacillus acetophenoni OX=614649 GN=SAMN05877842_103205 PE=4 SV=1 [Ureibacillus acetophenoni]